MDPAQIALWAAAAPAAAAVAALLVARALGAAGSMKTAAWAVALGYVAGHAGLEGIPLRVPVESWRWLPAFAVLGAAVATFETRISLAAFFLGPALRVAVALFVAWACVLSRTVLWIGVVAAGVYLLMGTLELAAKRSDAPPATLVVAVVAGATAVALFFAGTLRVAALAGALTAASGAVCIARRWLPSEPRGVVFPAALLLAGMLLNGVLLAEMPIPTAVLLALAPLGTELADQFAGRAMSPRKATTLRLVAVAALAGLAVALAAHAAPPTDY